MVGEDIWGAFVDAPPSPSVAYFCGASDSTVLRKTVGPSSKQVRPIVIGKTAVAGVWVQMHVLCRMPKS